MGRWPTFCFRWVMALGSEHLRKLLEPVVNAMDYELLGIEFHAHGGSGLMRVYIDAPDGIGLEDCERVSRQVSSVLDVEDPIPGHYTLEVSSPGLDRPLFTQAHFERFAGSKVKLQMDVPVNGRRKFAGVLVGMRDGQVVIREEAEEVTLPLERIKQARLVPEV